MLHSGVSLLDLPINQRGRAHTQARGRRLWTGRRHRVGVKRMTTAVKSLTHTQWTFTTTWNLLLVTVEIEKHCTCRAASATFWCKKTQNSYTEEKNMKTGTTIVTTNPGLPPLQTKKWHKFLCNVTQTDKMKDISNVTFIFFFLQLATWHSGKHYNHLWRSISIIYAFMAILNCIYPLGLTN